MAIIWRKRPSIARPASRGRAAPGTYLRGFSRSGLAQTPVHPNAPLRPQLLRPHGIGRQIDVPAVGKFEIPRKDTPRATLDDVSRAVGEPAGEPIDLARDTLAFRKATALESPVPADRSTSESP